MRSTSNISVSYENTIKRVSLVQSAHRHNLNEV